jgi:hypothetical protein
MADQLNTVYEDQQPNLPNFDATHLGGYGDLLGGNVIFDENYSGWGDNNNNNSGGGGSDNSNVVQNVADSLSKLLDDLSRINTYTPLIRAKLDIFKADSKALMDAFVAIDTYSKDQSDKLGAFADTLAKEAGALKTVADTFEGLAGYSYVSAGYLSALLGNARDMLFLVGQLSASFNYTETQTKQIGDFADLFGKVAGGLNSALEFFKGVTSFRQVSTASMNAFKADIASLTAWFNAMAQTVSIDLAAQIDKFAGAVNTTFGGLKSGLDVLAALRSYRVLDTTRLSSFMSDLTLLFNRANATLGALPRDQVVVLNQQANLLGQIFTNFKNMADAFQAMSSVANRNTPLTIVERLIDSLTAAVVKMGLLGSLTAIYRDGALDASNNLLIAANAFGNAASAMQSVGGLSLPTTTSSLSSPSSSTVYYATPTNSGTAVQIDNVSIVIQGSNLSQSQLEAAISNALLKLTGRATTNSLLSR